MIWGCRGLGSFKRRNYHFFVGLFGLLFGSVILFLPLLNTFLTGEGISVFSYALINFSGYLFFTMTFVELLFIQLVRLGGSPFLLVFVAVFTAICALSIDYLIGFAFSKSFLTKFISEKKLQKYQGRVEKYGDPIIFVFNVLPLSSPLLTLAAGLIRYSYRRILIFSLLGLVIKYSAVAFVVVNYF